MRILIFAASLQWYFYNVGNVSGTGILYCSNCYIVFVPDGCNAL